MPKTTHTSKQLPTVSRVMSTPIGPLTLVADEVGLRAVTWPGEDGSRVGLGTAVDPPVGGEADPSIAAVLDAAEAQLGEYFAGARREFDLPLHLVGTEFQQQAWRALAEIPFGETVSYGEQAAQLGRPKAVRAVGAANGRNPLSVVLPCHRVVGANGTLTGFAAGLDTKRWLLDHEAGRAVLPLTR
ncbi:MAG: methylated-DNA--[protein]-cysteine S-methyltransferase [Microthrixaceae bacterium]